MTKGLPVELRNLHFTTVLDVRRARNDERVARAHREFAFHHSFGRPTITFCVKGCFGHVKNLHFTTVFGVRRSLFALQCQDMWLSRQRTCSQAFYPKCDFSGVTSRKIMGNVDPKMGCKIWTPFWGPPNCFFFSRAPKRGPDFRPHFGVHIARFFRSMTPKKIIPE